MSKAHSNEPESPVEINEKKTEQHAQQKNDFFIKIQTILHLKVTTLHTSFDY
jgi:hypothetical protein